MNNTHREEVEIINQPGQLLVQDIKALADTQLITGKLHQWVEHTREHFNTENQMMRDYGFPVYVIHSGEHARVMQQIETLQRQWFDNHISSMDRVTAQFLSQAMG